MLIEKQTRVDRKAHAQAVSERHSGVRRRRGALHLRQPRDLRPHAQLRPVALRRLSQFLQQAVERDALRADERRRQGRRPRRDAADIVFACRSLDRRRAAARRRGGRQSSSQPTVSTSPPRRSTSSCGTSTATGTSSWPRSICARRREQRSAARGARWCACWKRCFALRIRSFRSSPRSFGRRSRRSRASMAIRFRFSPIPKADFAKLDPIASTADRDAG